TPPQIHPGPSLPERRARGDPAARQDWYRDWDRERTRRNGQHIAVPSDLHGPVTSTFVRSPALPPSRPPTDARPAAVRWLALFLVVLLAGCAAPPRPKAPLRAPEDVRAQLVSLLPATLADRE